MGRMQGKLSPRGPMVDVEMMLTIPHVEALKRAGKPFAPPMTIMGLIDTGASCSAVDRNLAAGLGLAAKGVVSVHPPTTGARYIDLLQYDVRMVLGAGQADALVLTLPIVESDFASEGFLALIGRDVLKSCRFTFDGPAETFTIEWRVGPRQKPRRPSP
jgi:hypothetical protein